MAESRVFHLRVVNVTLIPVLPGLARYKTERAERATRIRTEQLTLLDLALVANLRKSFMRFIV